MSNLKISIKKTDSDGFEDLYIDKDSVINAYEALSPLDKKVIRSSKEGNHYIVYSIIEKIMEVEQIKGNNILKIYFKGTQLRLQNYDTVTSYVREISKEKNKIDSEENSRMDLSLCLSLSLNYYDDIKVYNKLTETDYMENYKKFLKDERIHLLFK